MWLFETGKCRLDLSGGGCECDSALQWQLSSDGDGRWWMNAFSSCSWEHMREFPCCWKQLLATGSCKWGKKKGWNPLNNLGLDFFFFSPVCVLLQGCVAWYVSRVIPHHFSSTVQFCTRALAPLPAQMAAENGLILISESAWATYACYKSSISRK